MVINLAIGDVERLRRTRDLLGKLAASEAVGSLLADNHLPYTIVEDEQRKTVSVKTDAGELLSAEALVVRACPDLQQQLAIVQKSQSLARACKSGCMRSADDHTSQTEVIGGKMGASSSKE